MDYNDFAGFCGLIALVAVILLAVFIPLFIVALFVVPVV